MSLAGILAGILAVIKAIPAIQDIFNQLVHLYLSAMDAKTEAFFTKEREKRNYLIKKLEESENDQDIIDNFNDIMR